MDNRQQLSLRQKFAALLDDGRSAGLFGPDYDASADSTVSEVRRHLQADYRRDPDVSHIRLRVDGTLVGVTNRGRVMEEPGTAGTEQPGISDGDRAGSPGDSSQYRVLIFRCRRCGQEYRRMYYDEREIPVCADHGPAVLQR